MLSDKEIIDSVEYSEQAKDYRDSLKEDKPVFNETMNDLFNEIENNKIECMNRAYLIGAKKQKEQLLTYIKNRKKYYETLISEKNIDSLKLISAHIIKELDTILDYANKVGINGVVKEMKDNGKNKIQ